MSVNTLDSEAERAVKSNMDRLLKGRTAFVIAHRLTTTPDADAICVLEQGQIVEQGTHEELLNRQGLYAYLQASSSTGSDPSSGENPVSERCPRCCSHRPRYAAGNACGLVSIDLEIFERFGLIFGFDLLA